MSNNPHPEKATKSCLICGGGHLFHAVQKKSYEISELLISAGADFNAKNLCGQTPLMIAALNKDIEISELLLKSGADVNALNKWGKSALNYALGDCPLYGEVDTSFLNADNQY